LLKPSHVAVDGIPWEPKQVEIESGTVFAATTTAAFPLALDEVELFVTVSVVD
jgi:hypothetical protein